MEYWGRLGSPTGRVRCLYNRHISTSGLGGSAVGHHLSFHF